MSNQKKFNFSLENLLLFFSLLFVIIVGLIYVAFAIIEISKNNQKIEVRETEIIKVVNEESQVIEVVEQASSAVVSIIATAEVPIMSDPFFDMYSPFRHFFEYEERKETEPDTERIQVGAGTGFIVSPDGYIITNRHVVEDREAEYMVFLNDDKHSNEQIIAKVLALDPNNDLALLKIEANDLPYLEFADSDNLKIGQTAITIGYALGEFDNTVSKGIISGLSRSIVASSGYGSNRLYNLIQTDAAINLGNSGGPMLNIEGKVIGVNVAMARAENIGFAVPGNQAKQAFIEVKETGEIKEQEMAFLGVRYLAVNDRLQEINKLPYNYGALIVRGETAEELAVMPGSPADKAGLVENDIILEFAGQKITERRPLFEIIRDYSPGDEVLLKVYSKGEEKELEIILGSN
jgi:serine protease Do